MVQNAARLAARNRDRHERAGRPLRVELPRGLAPNGPTAAEDRDRLEKQRGDLEAAERAGKLVAASRVPRRYAKATLAGGFLDAVPASAAPAYAGAADVVRRLGREGGILALIGPCGTGKTWIAAGLVLDLCRSGRSARYLHAFDYLQGMRQTYGDGPGPSESKYESDHLRPELLVIDEVEERGDREWHDRMLRRLIVKRQDDRLATLILSNLGLGEFRECIGGKVLSRMQEDAGGVHQCTWGNLRGGAGR